MITFQDADKYTPPAVINWFTIDTVSVETVDSVPTIIFQNQYTPASSMNWFFPTTGPLKEIDPSMVFTVTVTNWKGVAW